VGRDGSSADVGRNRHDLAPSGQPGRRHDGQDDIIEVCVIVDTADPQRVGRAGVRQGHEDNQDEEKT
jgi:hypothetical protein